MNRCETTTGLFSEYYDGGLSPEERRSLEEHLQGCASCREEYLTFTRSLEALHDTAPLETTQVFLTNVRAAVQNELERHEGGGAPPAGRRGGPPLAPWALAAVALLALGAAYLGSRRDSDAGLKARLADLERRLAERPMEVPRPVGPAAPPVDEERFLAERGIVRENGVLVPRRMLEDFRAGRIYLEPGRSVSREEAARRLAEEFPQQPPPPPAPAPAAGGTTEEEILKKYDLVLHEGSAIPRAWLDRWRREEILVGPNRWVRRADLMGDLIRQHDLVEKGGRLVSRREAEEIDARQLVRRPEAAAAANAVTAALEGLRIGAPATHGGLTIYPLISPAPAREAACLPLHAALGLGEGKLEISDREGFFSVQVRNSLDSDVFFLAGEILGGGRCGRAVAADTLIPKGRTVSLPVVCVEPAVWRPAEARFARESGHYVAPPALRRALAGSLGQGAVWALLARGLGSGCSGQAEIFRRNADRLIEYGDSFDDLADREPGTVGMAVAVGGSVEMAEIFQSQALFRSYSGRLARAAALEAIDRAADAAWRPAPAFTNSVRGVKDFIESLFGCRFEARQDGFEMRRDDACAGRAAVAQSGLLHAVFFAPGAVEWRRRDASAVPREKLSKVLAEYAARLKDRSAGTFLKVSAVKELASINATEVVAVLTAHLRDADPAVRRAVVRELGACGDPAAVKDLLDLMRRSRKDIPLFAETVRALARIGDERAVDELLRQADGGDPETTRLVVQALPELLLQVRSREPLERAVRRLIDLFEAVEGAARGETVGDPTLARGFGRAEAQATADAARLALRQVTGIDHDKAARYRSWWNDPAGRERFLRDRTGK